MSDVAEVKVDIEETLGFYDGVEEAIPDALRGVLAAARRLVEVAETSQEVEWCETHGARFGHRSDGERFCVAQPTTFPSPCRFVSRRLVPSHLLGEDE